MYKSEPRDLRMTVLVLCMGLLLARGRGTTAVFSCDPPPGPLQITVTLDPAAVWPTACGRPTRDSRTECTATVTQGGSCLRSEGLLDRKRDIRDGRPQSQ